MGFKHFLPLKSTAIHTSHVNIQTHIFHSLTISSCSNRLIVLASFIKHISSPIYQQKSSGYTPYTTMPITRHVPGVDLESLEKQVVDQKQLIIVRQKLDEIGIDGSACMPGQFNGLICIIAKEVIHRGRAYLFISRRAFADVKSTYGRVSKVTEVKRPIREITEESLGLEPLSSELLAYFAERMISGETLQRNGVMQKGTGDKIAMAFTYRRNKVLVSCKYRAITKRFWQESDTEKIYYGLDDIKETSDIIIVEGEMDKLAIEESGFQNCVSVPDGAPSKVSKKSVPSEEEASRIILATDGDRPGQALAEELARRLGRERCWRVRWPKKNDAGNCKDANEVLMHVGPDALRAAIENAEPYG